MKPNTRRIAPLQRAAAGVSLTEVLSVISVGAAVATLGSSYVTTVQDDSRLRAAAEALAAELRQTMTHAIKSGELSMVALRSDGASGRWCFVPRTKINCDCRLAADCTIDALAYAVRSDAFPRIRMTSNVSQGTFAVQPRRATITAGHVEFTSSKGKLLRVVVNGYGRIRVCSPATPAPLAGYPLC